MSRKIPVEIPGDHPFARFLTSLPEASSCSPYPDIIESATACRYFVGFIGENASARQALFVTHLKKTIDNGAHIVTQHFGENQSRAVIFLTRFSPVYSRSIPDKHMEVGEQWLALREPNRIPPSPPADLDGCFQVPSL